jgi:hypothetical protein
MVLSMPNQPLSLNRPERCPSCHIGGGIRVEQTIKGDSVLLQWLCSTCQARWPVVQDDEVAVTERRSGTRERRRKTRQDRRSR